MESKLTYTRMRVKSKLNYRTACEITPATLAGVLEAGEEIRVLDGFEQVACEHSWAKFKLGRKHFFVCRMWLEPIVDPD